MPKPTPTYVRVKDPSTGHEFDVRETSPLLAKGLVERVKDDRYPPSPVARRPKFHTDLAGRPATRKPGKATAEPEQATASAAAEATTKEH